MRSPVTSRLFICCVCVLASLAAASAGAQTTDAAAGGERLSLNEAVRLAVANNRSLATARLQVEKAEADLAASRTRRLPSFETSLTGSQLVTPVNFSFPAGAFGTFPGIGPVPAADTNVTTPRQFSIYATAQMSQPITQLKKINLGVQTNEESAALERERVREQQLSLVNSVKRLYYSILQTESAIAATDETIALYRELDRTLDVRVAQKVALRGDALNVKAKLAQEEFTRLSRANTLASQKEQLNQLLGRDVRTSFAAEDVSTIAAIDVDLAAAQRQAVDQRPDIREARIKVQQADLDRRIKSAERIPDVGVQFSYLSNFNIDVLPRNLASVGVQVKWEPFDWGRKGRELAAKDAVVQQARLAVREAEDRAVVDVNTRFRKLGEARALLKVADSTRIAAREKLRVKTDLFQLQAALLSDVMQIRAEVADSNDQYQQALLSFWTAKADFELAVGEEVVP
jgi:outer membrane protein TolC